MALTHSGSMMGTPLYMAPEQWRDARKVDHRADVYSLGCVIYEMVCGRLPFTPSSFGDLVAAHMTQRRRSRAATSRACRPS